MDMPTTTLILSVAGSVARRSHVHGVEGPAATASRGVVGVVYHFAQWNEGAEFSERPHYVRRHRGPTDDVRAPKTGC